MAKQTETKNCPALTASPMSFMDPVFVPPVRISAFVDLAASMSPRLNVSFFLPSMRKFFAPPMSERARYGFRGFRKPQ